MSEMLREAECMMDEIVQIRRDLHQHPEIGSKEFRTAEIISKKLEDYGVDKIEHPMETAVVALIQGKKGDGKCVALRADIDALPVTEETGLPYSSQVPGMMHACGHDMHTAMLLGVAKILCGKRDEFAGTVKLIFQHSEDTQPGGAKFLVERGVLENPHVDAIFGMHVFPTENDQIGTIGLHSGPLTTSVDIYTFNVKGKAGHGSAPHTAKDAILAACQTVVLLQQIQSRYVNPLDTVIFPIGMIQGGTAVNIIPDSATFSGVARTYKADVRKKVEEQVTQITKGVEALSGCTIDVDLFSSYPSCYNDEALLAQTKKGLAEVLGEDKLINLPEPLSFSEDFSYYTEMSDIPGLFMLLHAGHEGEDLVSLHNPKCAMKEEAMPVGITAMASAALNYLR